MALEWSRELLMSISVFVGELFPGFKLRTFHKGGGIPSYPPNSICKAPYGSPPNKFAQKTGLKDFQRYFYI